MTKFGIVTCVGRGMFLGVSQRQHHMVAEPQFLPLWDLIHMCMLYEKQQPILHDGQTR